MFGEEHRERRLGEKPVIMTSVAKGIGGLCARASAAEAHHGSQKAL